jgi:hypothetical protein
MATLADRKPALASVPGAGAQEGIMAKEQPLRLITVLHRMDEAELAETIRSEGRERLAKRLTGMQLKGMIIAFVSEEAYEKALLEGNEEDG